MSRGSGTNDRVVCAMRRAAHAALPPCAAVIGAALLLHVTGIHCPIKFMTGISCPGCGMTRAWLAALSLRFDLALAYHPLFWAVPLVLGFIELRCYMPPRAFRICTTLAVVAFIAVWAVRLVLPHGSNVLFSSLLTEDVVSVEMPGWLIIIRSIAHI